MARRRFAQSVALACALCGAQTAHATPARVAILEAGSPALAEDLVDALRIFAHPQVELVVIAATPQGSLADKTSAAARHAEETGATLVVWVDPPQEGDEGALEAILYLVGRRKDRLLVEIANVPAGEAHGLSRELALKVVEVLDLVLAVPPEPAAIARALMPPLRPRERPKIAERPAGILAASVLGIGPTGSVDPRWGTQFAAGARIPFGRWSADVVAQLELATLIGASSTMGDVRARTITPGLGLCVLGPLRPRPALCAAGRAHLVEVTGSAVDGRTGSAYRVIPNVSLGAGLRVGLGRWMELDLGAGVEWALLRQRFTLDGDAAVDLGSFVPWVRAGVVALLR